MRVGTIISNLKNRIYLLCIATFAAINCFVAYYSSFGAWLFTFGSLLIWRNYTTNVLHEDRMVEIENKSQTVSTKKLRTSAFMTDSPSPTHDVGVEKLLANLINVILSKYWDNIKVLMENAIPPLCNL